MLTYIKVMETNIETETVEEKNAYAKIETWNNFYSDNSSFEWYTSWTTLRRYVLKYLTCSGTALVIGCGNSEMSANLLDDGFLRVVSIDNSDVVINQMKEKYKEEPRLVFENADCRKISYQDNLFDATFEKGTIDTLTCGSDAEEKVKATFEEITRTLKPNGYFFMVSFGSPVTRKRFLDLGLPKLVLIDSLEAPKPGITGGHHYIYVFRKVIQ